VVRGAAILTAVTIHQAFELALQHHQAGRLAEAEALYRQILGVQSNRADALHLLGVIAHQSGRQDVAEDLIRRAISLAPNSPRAHANLAAVYRAQGRTEEAIASYHRSIQLQPDDAQIHHHLGDVLWSMRRTEDAIAAFRRALQLQPDFAETENNLGVALLERSQFDEAIAAFRHALQSRPQYPEACNNLGIALGELGRIDESMAAFHQALQLNPNHANACNNMGMALARQGRLEEAIAAYRQALQLHPHRAEIHNNLGGALRDSGRLDEGLAAYHRALQLKPDYADAHNNAGIALGRQGRLDEAMAAYRRALEINPDHADAHNNLGLALAERGQLDEALASCRRALELNPASSEMRNNLGNVLKDRGELDEAIAAFREALRLQSRNSAAYSNLIYTLHFHPGAPAEAVAGEQQRWNRQFSGPVKLSLPPCANDRDPDRRLRIGYVSPDFRDHVIGRNIMPLFRERKHEAFEILCYSGVARLDNLTHEFRAHADQWHNTMGVNDEALAEMIQRDGVDILVDLSQHLAGNRLTMFARQPAPMQVSFAGYPASAGVEGIRYRISDQYLECEMRNGECGMEEVFLIDCFWCYDPCGMDLQANTLPAQTNGRITFGSLNNYCKVNEPLLKLWARVLGRVADSRLVLLSAWGGHRQRAVEVLEREGVKGDRIEFVEPGPRRAYLELYHRLDVVLDTFPYNGHTTSLDALWMGLPVVSLAGGRAVSRAGLSQLSNLGLPELVAFSEEDYVAIAARLASDLPRLAELRRTLRGRMETSVLMNAERFTRGIEAAYRGMWRRWCTEKASS